MKFNWRVLIAVVLIGGGILWAVDSVRTRSYAGTNLNFLIGRGPVTVTNPSDESVAVQLVGKGSRSFSVSSSMEGVSGAPTRQGTGSTTTQLFAFDLPPGVSEFTVVRGGASATDVNFVGNADTRLDATVQPLDASDARTTILAAAVIVLGGLFYISRTTEHRWISTLRRQPAAA